MITETKKTKDKWFYFTSLTQEAASSCLDTALERQQKGWSWKAEHSVASTDKYVTWETCVISTEHFEVVRGSFQLLNTVFNFDAIDGLNQMVLGCRTFLWTLQYVATSKASTHKMLMGVPI